MTATEQNINDLIDKIYELSEENAKLRKELQQMNYLLIGVLIGCLIAMAIIGS